MRGSGPSRREILAALVAAGLCGCESHRRTPGTVLVGSSATGIPFSFIDPWTNELTGSLVDTARAVTQQISLTIELRVVPFAALIPSLLSRKIDMIAAAMLRTPEREKVVAFSDPVFAYSGGLVVPKTDSRHHADLASLRDLRVGTQVGTRFTDQANEAGIKHVLTYDNIADMLRDVVHGRIDAVYGDEPILEYQLHTGTRPQLRMVSEFVAPGREELCLVFRRGDTLIPKVNEAIKVLQPTVIPQITHRWGLK